MNCIYIIYVNNTCICYPSKDVNPKFQIVKNILKLSKVVRDVFSKNSVL